jgi:CheY-like chemotaxis protein
MWRLRCSLSTRGVSLRHWCNSGCVWCCGCGAGVEASQFIDSGSPADIMLLDIRMPLRSGVEVVEGCAHRWPPYPIVAMTGHVDVEAREQFK